MTTVRPEDMATPSRPTRKVGAALICAVLLLAVGWGGRAWWSSDSQELRRAVSGLRDAAGVSSVEGAGKGGAGEAISLTFSPNATPEQVAPVIRQLADRNAAEQTPSHLRLGTTSYEISKPGNWVDAPFIARTMVALGAQPNATVISGSSRSGKMLAVEAPPTDALAVAAGVLERLYPTGKRGGHLDEPLYIVGPQEPRPDANFQVGIHDVLVDTALARIDALKPLAPASPHIKLQPGTVEVSLPAGQTAQLDGVRTVRAAQAAGRVTARDYNKATRVVVKFDGDNGPSVAGGADPLGAISLANTLQAGGFRGGYVSTNLSELRVSLTSGAELTRLDAAIPNETSRQKTMKVRASWPGGEFVGSRGSLKARAKML